MAFSWIGYVETYALSIAGRHHGRYSKFAMSEAALSLLPARRHLKMPNEASGHKSREACVKKDLVMRHSSLDRPWSIYSGIRRYMNNR